MGAKRTWDEHCERVDPNLEEPAAIAAATSTSSTRCSSGDPRGDKNGPPLSLLSANRLTPSCEKIFRARRALYGKTPGAIKMVTPYAISLSLGELNDRERQGRRRELKAKSFRQHFQGGCH